MLKRLWQWLKSFIQRLLGSKQTSSRVLVEQETREPRKQLTDTEYESLFLQLLAEVNDGLTKGGVKGFLAANRIDDTNLQEWLRGFGDKLLASSESHHELAGRMVQLGELGIGEVSNVAYDIGRRLLERGGGTNQVLQNRSRRLDAEKAEGTEEGEAKTVTPDELLVMLQQDANLVQQLAQQLGIETSDPQIIIEALISQIDAGELPTDDAQAWVNKGISQYETGDFEGALASWDKALELKPDFYNLWYNRGIVLNNLGQYEQALASYDNALKFKPDFYNAWCMRGWVLNTLGRYEQALVSYDKALELDPDEHHAWHGRGNVLNNSGRYEQALASYDKALEFKPDCYQAWEGRGNALNNLGRYEQAITSYDKALEFKPDYHSAWYNRGPVLRDLGRYEQAIASYDKALEFKPDYHSAWYNRGNALGDLGRYEQAIACYDKALELKPDAHNAWNNRGNAAGQSVSCDRLLASLSVIARKNPALNQRGYEGELASYEEGLKYCHQDTHPEGWGVLHRAIGRAHYFQGHRVSYPRPYWYKAVHSYNEALKTLTEADFPELHLNVLQDLIRVQLDLRKIAKAEELQRRGTDLLRRLLDECESLRGCLKSRKRCKKALSV